jgi:hypothetical protein
MKVITEAEAQGANDLVYILFYVRV